MEKNKKEILKENLKKTIKEEMNRKKVISNKLANKWKSLLESSKYGAIKESDHGILSVMLENQHQYAVKEGKRKGMEALYEANISDNSSIQPYLKILVPILRRSYKLMSAMELVGQQPLTAPQGYIFALRFMYAGDDTLRMSNPSNLDRLMGTDLNFMSYALSFGFLAGGSFSDIKYNDPANFDYSYVIRSNSADADAELDGKTLAVVISDASADVYGRVMYAESNLSGGLDGGTTNVATDVNCKIAVNRHVEGGTVSDIVEPNIDLSGNKKLWICNFDTSGNLTAKKQIETVYMSNKNEIGFDYIFKHYTGGMTTAQGEYLGSTEPGAGKYRTIKMTVERKNVETKTNKLRLQYTDEMYEDLQKMHGLNAAEELTKMAEVEIANEINAIILQAIYQTATTVKSWSYGKAGIIQQDSISHPGNVADGLDQTKKFETLATKIRFEANNIAKETRRGAGNYIVVTTDVLTALQSTNMFSPSAGDDLLVAGLSYAGMLGKMKVYVDTYNVFDGNFVLVGYKGANNQMDAGIIYSSYIPLQVKKAIDPNTFQECIGFRTRYAITTTLLGAHRYYRLFSVDLTGSMISA